MDYTAQKFVFKVKKLSRYTRMYGVSRTLAKVKGQYHFKKTYAAPPPSQDKSRAGRHVGILGCGNFAYSVIAYYLRKNYGKVLRGVMDVDLNHAASLHDAYDADFFTDDAERVIRDPKTDLIYVASNHASHADYAIRAMEAGKAVHIEKPHVVSEDQLVRLCRAMQQTGRGVVLGFNRPFSRLGKKAKGYLDAETGTAMFNWFVVGHDIPETHWYYHPQEGGRVLGNLCHWTDFLLHLVPPEVRYPIEIVPARSERSHTDISVSFIFGEGSIGTITFSSKGHTFEGVRERFAAHRGNAVVALDDFQHLTADVAEKKHSNRLLFRDHGHEETIRAAYSLVRPQRDMHRATVEYVWQTGDLFLKTKEALDAQRRVRIESGTPRV